VFVCVFVGRGVAAADVTALETFAQVHPRVAALETLFATWSTGLDFVDVVEVGAFYHGALLLNQFVTVAYPQTSRDTSPLR